MSSIASHSSEGPRQFTRRNNGAKKLHCRGGRCGAICEPSEASWARGPHRGFRHLPFPHVADFRAPEVFDLDAATPVLLQGLVYAVPYHSDLVKLLIGLPDIPGLQPDL